MLIANKCEISKEVQWMMHEIDIRPAKRTYTFHKYGRKCLFHIGDTIRFYKKNKINHAEYVDTFVCEGVNESAQKLKGKGIAKKFRFCSVLKAGCTPFVGFRKLTLT